MERSNLIKIAAAFAGGIVVALGGASMYFRTSDVQRIQPVAQVTPAVAQRSAETPHNDPPAQEAAAPAVDPPPMPVRRHKERVRRDTPRPVLAATPEPAGGVQQVAVNTPPQVVTPVSAPTQPLAQPATRAVNEDQYQGPQPTPEAQANPAPPPAPKPHVVTLAAGTNIFIRLGETLSSERNYAGDTFRGTLEQPIVLDGFIIADRGSKVLGQVTSAERAGRVHGTSELNLTLTEVNTTDGQQIRVVTDSFDKHGTKGKGKDAAKIAGGAALGAIIGALGGGGKGAAIGAGAGGAAGTGVVLATRGDAATIPAETRMQFRLTSPVTITEKLNN